MSSPHLQPHAASAGVVHNLVICGATDPESNADGAMFDDFMGMCSLLTLLQPDFKGTFLSCFPLEKHFDFLGSKSPPITDIKWGKRGTKGSPVLVYTREKFDRSPSRRWYQYVPAKSNAFYIEVVAWIWKKLNEAQPGDAVNLFFQCHGTEGGIVLGQKVLDNERLVSLLRGFRKGVQVNAIGSHCHSEYLVKAIRQDKQSDRYVVAAAGQKQFHYTATRAVSDRFRNFRFSQPFVESVARSKLPGLHQADAAPLTVEKHDASMEAEMAGPPKNLASAYSSYLSTNKSAAVEELSNVLLRDYADVLFQVETNPSREHQILPSIVGNLKAVFAASSANAPPAAKAAAQALVTASASLCNEDLQDIYDMPVFDNLYHVKTPNYDRTMKVLYWRATQMYNVWSLFVYLTHRGFLSMKSLAEPMEFRNESDEVSSVMLALYCFEYATTEYRAKIFPQDFLWPMALKWFAVTIVRSAIKPVEMFSAINDSGALGRLNTSKLEECISEAKFPCDPLNMAGNETPSFGFWLPHGLGSDNHTWIKKTQDSVDTFQKIHRAYFDYFKVPEEIMAAERPQQVETLFENPLYMPPTPVRPRRIEDL